ncbi:amino acid permease-domain-containing protein [Boeremia exigua]|uniref:amino acid permease-domain-containing protein n=1 Tax=Boeremia exigua TaxID=749465 RepID=UPI001E8CEE5E|nr:amino acid permease-domain-containing protein [Boeremia exigua]KAH6643830.1 amino acid permease-domain-containing protein [Boeremia exigua]
MASSETEPLLASSHSQTDSTNTYINSDDGKSTQPSRSIEDDVLPETSTLGRTITWSSAYILVISRVIGSGIFATPGVIVKAVGSVGLSLSLWVLGAVIAACGLAVALEYGCMLPRSGGDKVYLEFTYRKPRYLASTLMAIQAVLLGFTASNCIIFAQYTLYAFDIEATDFLRKSLAVGLLTAITIVHGCFRKTGIAIQNFLGWIKVGLVVFMVFSGLFVVIFKPQGLDGRRSHFPTGSDVWKDTEWSWGTISTSLFKVFYSYAGLNNVSNVLNEVRNPVRTLKSVSITALVTACVLYSLVNIAYFIVIPLDEIKASKELIAALFFEKLFGPTIGKVILPLAVALSGVGNVMVVTFALARLNQEIARQGFLPFPEILASSKPFNAPLGGLIVHYIPSLLVIALPPSGEVYSFILEVEGYPGQIFALATSAGLLWLRYSRPDLKRPFRAWNIAIVLRIALCLVLLAAPFFPPEHRKNTGIWYATYAVVGTSVILFGFLYWYMWLKLIPILGGYRVEEKTSVLDDETYDRPFESHPVVVKDVRGRESEYSLDSNGFQFYKHPSVEKDFVNDEQIKDQYYKEIEQLLKDATGATRIHIFDHTIRRQQPGDASTSRQLRGPVQRVHIDQSYDAALSRVPFHLPDDADKLLQSRVQIINVWRPIKTVQRDPLAVAEASSVSDDSLVVTELIYPTRRGETYAVKHDPAHQWFYKSNLTPEEVILIKCFDSKKDGRARRVPHTAFHVPGTEEKEGRESIEVRALVFHEHESLE